MAFECYAIPNFEGTEVDIVALDPTNSGPNSPGLVHYAYTVAAETNDVLNRRSGDWLQLQSFREEEYQYRQPEVERGWLSGRSSGDVSGSSSATVRIGSGFLS